MELNSLQKSKIINVQQLIELYDDPAFNFQQEKYAQFNIVPKMAAILPNQDPGSISYMKGIKKFCQAHSIDFQDYIVANQDDLEQKIKELNQSDVNGIMIMYPTGFEKKDTYFMNLINQEKDVEGLHYANLGYLVQFEKYRDVKKLRKLIIPPTAKGIMYIFKRNYQFFEDYHEKHGKYPENMDTNPYNIEGKQITIINDSLAVGRSLALMLLNENGSVQVCHKYTPFEEILKYIRQSNIIVSAVPSRKFIIPTHVIPENAFIIDLSFEGNFEYPQIFEKCYKIAPKWNLVDKGNRLNDMTLNRLIANLFYLSNSKLPDEILKELKVKLP